MDILIFNRAYPEYNIYEHQPYVIRSKLMRGENFLISRWEEEDNVWELSLFNIRNIDFDLYRQVHSELGESYFILIDCMGIGLNNLLQMRRDYYTKALKVADIQSNYKLVGRPVVRAIPIFISSMDCLVCSSEESLYFPIKRDQAFKAISEFPSYANHTYELSVCCYCGHHEGLSPHKGKVYCQCSHCESVREEVRQVELSTNLGIINHHYGLDKNEAVNIDNASLKDLMFLYAYLRSCSSDDLSFILPIDDIKELNLAPTYDDGLDILRYLFFKKLIVVDPKSKESSFVFEDYEEGENLRFYMNKVSYLLNIESEDVHLSISESIKLLERLIEKKVKQDRDAVESLWLDIASMESYQYLDKLFTDRNFSCEKSEKINHAIRTCLEDVSQSGLYYFMFLCVKNCSDLIMRSPMGRRNVFQTVPKKLLNYRDRALGEKWKIKNYNRPYDLPQSVLSSIFFDRFMGGTSKTFTVPVCGFIKQEP